MNLNKIILMGRMTRDPEMITAGDTKGARFTLAVNRDYKDSDGNTPTDFLPVVAWRQTAEFVEKYFHQGSAAIVVGRLQSRTFEDKDGNRRTAYEISADEVRFGESRKDKGAAATEGPTDEDAPF